MALPYAEVVGDPIAHSKSPAIHKFWLGKLGMEGDYRLQRVKAGELIHYLELRRRDPDWRGCNATMPLKTELHDLLARDTGLPDAARSFNCAFPISPDFPQDALPLNVALIGTSTDHLGLVEPFLDHLFQPGPLVVVGTGGAARRALVSLSVFRFTESVILSRDPAAAVRLLEALGIKGRAQTLDARLPPASLLVNASPLGMRGFPELGLDLAPLPDHAAVYDLVYDPVDTGLIGAARARGLKAIDGLTMLIGQARVSFQLFFKQLAPREYEDELRERLAR